VIKIDYTVELLSDAEPGTGLGTEMVDDLVPRDHRGNPMLPGSHIKGLVRESLEEIGALRGWDDELVASIFGMEGDAKSDGAQGCVRFSALTLPSDVGAQSAPRASLITRTAIDDALGIAKDGSLRTVESIPQGTTFKGSVWVDSHKDSAHDLAIRLGLSSLDAVGGNRRRGAGACKVTVTGESRTPSALLAAAGAAAARGESSRTAPSHAAAPSSGRDSMLGSETVWLELIFTAEDPLCCPEVPLTKTNLLRGGFSVPASAVQGAILDRLNASDTGLATATFNHRHFRAWPLLPCAYDGEDSDGRFPIWTSLTHKMAKTATGVADPPETIFADAMLEPLDLAQVSRKAGMKAADGVLVRMVDGAVRLWRASDMPRHISAHVNLRNNTPLLYTVDALAPMTLRGLVCMPAASWHALEKSLKQSDRVWFGKSRSIRGGGTLHARVLHGVPQAFLSGRHQTFIVQSPLLVTSSEIAQRHSGDVLASLIRDSWKADVERAEAALGMRFGWNRHGIGHRTDGRNRLSAATVVLPGSIFRLKEPITVDLMRLAAGIGGGRERGFGAVLPHPGKASGRLEERDEPITLKSRDRAGEHADALVKESRDSGLSASQVARLEASCMRGANGLEERIRELEASSPRNYERWKHALEALRKIVRSGPSEATLRRTMRGWRDALAAQEDAR
jgi:hypothetical protein